MGEERCGTDVEHQIHSHTGMLAPGLASASTVLELLGWKVGLKVSGSQWLKPLKLHHRFFGDLISCSSRTSAVL